MQAQAPRPCWGQMCLSKEFFLPSHLLLFFLPGTFQVLLLQVTAPAVVRWLKNLACPLAGLSGRVGLQNTLVVHLSLHQPGEVWLHKSKWGQTAQGHWDTPAPCHFTQPLHAASSPRLHPWLDDPQPAWHRSQSALHLFKDFHLRIWCQPKVTDNRVMTRICWNTPRLCFSTLGC